MCPPSTTLPLTDLRVRGTNGCGASRGRCRQPGFTLIEVMAVVVVLAVAASLIIPAITATQDDSLEKITWANLTRVRDAILSADGYSADMKYASDSAGMRFGYGSGLPWAATTNPDRQDHPQLQFLFAPPEPDPANPYEPLQAFDPWDGVGWRGPYIEPSSSITYPSPEGLVADALERSLYGDDGSASGVADRSPADGWLSSIVIQVPAVTPGRVTEEELLYARLVSAGMNRTVDAPIDSLFCYPDERGDDLVLFLFVPEPERAP